MKSTLFVGLMLFAFSGIVYSQENTSILFKKKDIPKKAAIQLLELNKEYLFVIGGKNKIVLKTLNTKLEVTNTIEFENQSKFKRHYIAAAKRVGGNYYFLYKVNPNEGMLYSKAFDYGRLVLDTTTKLATGERLGVMRLEAGEEKVTTQRYPNDLKLVSRPNKDELKIITIPIVPREEDEIITQIISLPKIEEKIGPKSQGFQKIQKSLSLSISRICNPRKLYFHDKELIITEEVLDGTLLTSFNFATEENRLSRYALDNPQLKRRKVRSN